MEWYGLARFGLRKRWDAAPALRALFPCFDAWARWMLKCTGVNVLGDVLADIDAQADIQIAHANARLALLRDPGAHLPAGLQTIYEDGPEPTLWLYGPIVGEPRTDLVSPRAVRLALTAASHHCRHFDALHLRISSPGGDMAAAAECARLLSGSRWRNRIVIQIDHLCHSAAAVHLLPVAGRVVMREGATLMIHETSQLFWGRASDCMRIARDQRRDDEAGWRQLAQARSIPFSRVRRLALGEVFLSARQAKRLGLVDEIAPALPALTTEEIEP